MIIQAHELEIMHQVMAGKIEREEIGELPSRRLRVVAAVAYILHHRERYLNEGNFLLTRYEPLLREIIGLESATPYVTYSLNLGLHESLRASLPFVPQVVVARGSGRMTELNLVTRILPPQELEMDEAERAVLHIMRQINRNGPEVARLVYEKLKVRFPNG